MPADPADQDIVRRMRADGDAETADDEDPGEEDARHPAEDEGEPGEGLAGRCPRGGPARRARPSPSPPGHSRAPAASAAIAASRRRWGRGPGERVSLRTPRRRGIRPGERSWLEWDGDDRRESGRAAVVEERESEVDQPADAHQSDRQDEALEDHPDEDRGREPPVQRACDLPSQQDHDQEQGRNHWSVRPADPSTWRSQASAPVRKAPAVDPPWQRTASS